MELRGHPLNGPGFALTLFRVNCSNRRASWTTSLST